MSLQEAFRAEALPVVSVDYETALSYRLEDCELVEVAVPEAWFKDVDRTLVDTDGAMRRIDVSLSDQTGSPQGLLIDAAANAKNGGSTFAPYDQAKAFIRSHVMEQMGIDPATPTERLRDEDQALLAQEVAALFAAMRQLFINRDDIPLTYEKPDDNTGEFLRPFVGENAIPSVLSTSTTDHVWQNDKIAGMRVKTGYSSYADLLPVESSINPETGKTVTKTLPKGPVVQSFADPETGRITFIGVDNQGVPMARIQAARGVLIDDKLVSLDGMPNNGRSIFIDHGGKYSESDMPQGVEYARRFADIPVDTEAAVTLQSISNLAIAGYIPEAKWRSS